MYDEDIEYNEEDLDPITDPVDPGDEPEPDPDPPVPVQDPVLIEVTTTTVTLRNFEGYEYSIGVENWQDSNVFINLDKNTEYFFYQRIKETEEEPASEYTGPLAVKTLEHDGPVSPSGYELGQSVELCNINVYPSPYAKFSNLKLSGIYYIYAIDEANHRIRITKEETDVNIVNRETGWVNISDLLFIEDEIYVGDKVIVTGKINLYADGSGTFLEKNKEEMFVTDIVSDYEYGYGVTTKPGLKRQAFAKKEQLTKYKIIKN